MPYSHYAKIGDVWKHLPLCSILEIEKPRIYMETNSAYATYKLAGTPEQLYGAGHCYTRTGQSAMIKDSAYIRLLCKLNPAAGQLQTYPGSPAQAMQLLQGITEKFIFFDLEEEALQSVRAYAASINLQAEIRTHQCNSIAGTHAMLDDLDENAFIHFDPYMIFEPGADGRSYFDLFLAAAARRIRCMLWYGFMTGNEKKAIHERISSETAALDSRPAGIRLQVAAVYLECIRPGTIIFNPGIMGCGIITCNLSPSSRDQVQSLARELVLIYKDSHYLEHPGALCMETFTA